MQSTPSPNARRSGSPVGQRNVLAPASPKEQDHPKDSTAGKDSEVSTECIENKYDKLDLSNWKVTFKKCTMYALPEMNWMPLSELRALAVDNHALSYLPNDLAYLAKLRSLSLCNNNFTSLPEIILKLRRLTHINISGNTINELPCSLFTKCRNLIKLEAANCGLSGLPVEISLCRIQTLNISGNNFQSIPVELYLNCAETALEVLNLDDNEIVWIPRHINVLKNLTTLSLAGNKIKGFPSIDSLKKLRMLNLQRNPVKGVLKESASDVRYIRSPEYKQKAEEYSAEEKEYMSQMAAQNRKKLTTQKENSEPSLGSSELTVPLSPGNARASDYLSSPSSYQCVVSNPQVGENVYLGKVLSNESVKERLAYIKTGKEDNNIYSIVDFLNALMNN
eukprot:CAMPEP_0177671484 /NCGR_PEP_ID=MMETSP0447-20121125/24736_1 /TAXON_ID=0 /ORGANISM="Stygamoeba regulata, Strain BSH-02190019" /LENGTH=392 /DNA_ID=CAMNT_0019178895 /DNA_START=136 /DNA_END=1312 /DNA_ORIENTATION=+